jgi:predicted Zn-dependent protease
MGGFFYNLGKMVGPPVRKGKWVIRSLTGTKAEILKAEFEVGQDLVREIHEQSDYQSDPDCQQRLGEIGAKLADRLTDKRRHFTFETIAGREPNAFAVPGGFIFMNRALADLCAWQQDEVAFILAHEMGHVVRGHAIERVLAKFAIGAAAKSAPVRSLPAGVIKQIGVRFLENAYSHNIELQSDEFGARLTDAALYDPYAAVKLLQRLADWQKTKAGFQLPRYFSSHPPFAERIANLKHLLHEL